MTLYKLLQAVYIKPTWLPVASLQMFRMRKLRNLTLVQFLSQCNMQLSMVLFLKPLSTYSLVYFETVQKATVWTAEAEIVNR